jgi:hypothetical protein
MILLAWILLIVAFIYAYAILSLWRGHRIPVHQQYTSYQGAPPQVPAATLNALALKSRELVSAGFRDLGLMTHTRPDGASVLVAFHDHPDGAVTAVALAAVRAGRQASGGVFLNFVTEFVDGFRLSTNNASYNFPMRRDPTGAVIQFPCVSDAAELGALHWSLVRRRSESIRPRVPGPDASQFFGDRVDAEMVRQRELGTVRTSLDGTMYRLTIIGAATMAWRLLPPSAPILRMLLRRRARHLRKTFDPAAPLV